MTINKAELDTEATISPHSSQKGHFIVAPRLESKFLYIH